MVDNPSLRRKVRYVTSLPTPRQQFLKDERAATEHASLMASRPFRHAANVALLQVVDSVSDTTDPVDAAAAYHRIIGAREYLKKLLTLGDVTNEAEPLPPEKTSALNFNA
jgi:hypothetical protein